MTAPAPEPGPRLTFDQVTARAGGRWTGEGDDTGFDVVIVPPLSEVPVPARVVPTRMHTPGWYVASPHGLPVWAGWRLRSPDDLAMVERFCDAGRVRLPAPAAPATDLDAAMHSVWLHGKWTWLTGKMTTRQREAAWAAVKRHSAATDGPDDEPLSDESAWWRQDRPPTPGLP